ncbi:MAG TPA: phosphatidate cytidylyltransferase [Gammaproteobacteria bacterium]
MLKQRIITAVLLVPLVLGVILFAPSWLFDAVVGVALVLLSLEFAALCGLRVAGSALFAAVVTVLFALAIVPWSYAPDAGLVLLAGAAIVWLLAPLWLASRFALPAWVKLLFGLPMLAGAGFALHGLKQLDVGGTWILLAFVLVWAADIGGYAAGRAFGRHKLAPAISPGKTWEGFGGGIVLVLVIGALAAMWFVDENLWLAWAILLIVLAVFSVVGDLLESLLKRQAGVKDSGNLLPGHGGLLDRLDSLLAVAPLFLLIGSRIGIFDELSCCGL